MIATDEPAIRIRNLHTCGGSDSLSSKKRDSPTRSGTQEASRCKPEQARTKTKEETEGQAPRFPRRFRPLVQSSGLFSNTNQFRVLQSFTSDLRDGDAEAVCITDNLVVRVLSGIEPERLLIDVAEQVIRLNRNVGAVNSALQKTPEVLRVIGVYVFADVFNRVVDHLMSVLRT